MPRVAPELQASAQSFCGAALRSEAFKRDARLNKSFVRAGARRMELYADEVKDIKKDNFLRTAFWEGDTSVDAFLTAAAAQVGQVLLTLPSSFATTGLAVGILFQLAFATAALWTLYMLAGLYQEFRKQRQLWRRDLHHGIIMVTLDDLNMTGWTDKVYCVQYHEIIYELCGPWLGTASWIVNVLALVGLAVAQVIACASNMHRLSSRFTKRDYALLFGSIGLLMTFIPSFRNMRIFSCIALLGTTFTAWYLVAYAGSQGYQKGLWGIPDNQSLQTFVEGGTNLLFVYGGHAMLVEVMDSMHQPRKFPKVFRGSYFYIFTLTLPSAATVYAALPTLSSQHGNIFDALPSSLTRSTSIVLMIAHQCFAYAMFIMPVHHMWEKAIGTHDKPYWIRLPSRIPVGTVVMLIALAFPFFGVINSFLGAGTTTLETYIIPAVAYNWVYRHEKAQTACASPPPWVRYRYGWKLTLTFNYILITCTFVFGMGFGMWASMLDLVKNTSEFGIFAACYNCAT